MKLNKEVCKKCMEINDVTTVVKKHKYPLPWCDLDDKRWEAGYVCCPTSGLNKPNNRVPDGCKYKLEHLVIK